MSKTCGSADPLGRPRTSYALLVIALVSALLITGSAWPSPRRSVRAFLDGKAIEIAERATGGLVQDGDGVLSEDVARSRR